MDKKKFLVDKKGKINDLSCHPERSEGSVYGL